MSLEDDCSGLFGAGKRFMGEGQRIVAEMLASDKQAPSLTARAREYEEAAEAYDKTKQNPTSFKEEVDEIRGFVCGQEWESVLKLLKSSNSEIQIGYEEGAHSHIGYFLNKDGFVLKFTSNQVTKLVASSVDVTEEIVLQIAKAFRNLFPKSLRGSFEGVVFGRLNEIAENRPK